MGHLRRLWTPHVATDHTWRTPAAAAAKSLQSCPTLCDPIDSSPPGSHPWDTPGKNTGVGCHFLLQCMKVKSESEVSRVRLLAIPWTAAYQAPLSMGFSRQEYWSGVPLPYIAFIMWRYVPSIPAFWRVFNHKWMLNFVKGFLCIYWDNLMVLNFNFQCGVSHWLICEYWRILASLG